MKVNFSKQQKGPKVKNRLSYYRGLRNLSQKKLALILEVTPSQISKWERGNEYPNSIRMFELAIACRRPVEEIFERLFNEAHEKIWQREKDLGFLETDSRPPFFYT